MRKLLLCVLAMWIGPPVHAASNCDCTIYPWRPNPPCVGRCSAYTIAESDQRTLVRVFKLSPEGARTITALKSKPDDLSGYAKYLPEAEYRALAKRANSLSQTEFAALQEANRSQYAHRPPRDTSLGGPPPPGKDKPTRPKS